MEIEITSRLISTGFPVILFYYSYHWYKASHKTYNTTVRPILSLFMKQIFHIVENIFRKEGALRFL
jgi:hypothetical protein